MVAWAPSGDVPSVPAAKSRRRASATRQARRGLAGGVVWIGLVAVLLAGVVALNVAVLRLNMRLEGLGRERVDLRAENALLASELSTTLNQRRIDSLAQLRLGLVRAEDPTYVDLARGR
jgi:hypothetical protein